MEIQTLSLPSRGWKSQLPESFDMRMFGGKELSAIARAIETKDLSPILLEALPATLSINIDMLTVQDAHALIFQQRMWLKDHPLQVPWKCNKPLFEYSTGILAEPLEEENPLNVFSCDAHNIGIIGESAVSVLTLTAESSEFDLVRMKNYERAQESMFHWHVAHMGLDFDYSYGILEEQQDMKLWMRLSEWVRASTHGIPNEIILTCPVCHRESSRTWEMLPSIFNA